MNLQNFPKKKTDEQFIIYYLTLHVDKKSNNNELLADLLYNRWKTCKKKLVSAVKKFGESIYGRLESTQAIEENSVSNDQRNKKNIDGDDSDENDQLQSNDDKKDYNSITSNKNSVLITKKSDKKRKDFKSNYNESGKKYKKFNNEQSNCDQIFSLDELSADVNKWETQIKPFEYEHKYENNNKKTVIFSSYPINYLIQNSNLLRISKPTIISCIIGIEQINTELILAIFYRNPVLIDLRALVLLCPSGGDNDITDKEYLEGNDDTDFHNNKIQQKSEMFERTFLNINRNWQTCGNKIDQIYDKESKEIRKVIKVLNY